MAADPLSAPPLHLLVREWPRAALTVARLAGASGRLKEAPRGDGRPVLVLPGLFNSDRSNFALRGYLARQGYAAHPWTLGRNLGVRTIGGDAERLFARVEAVSAAAGQPVTLVGVSLGGIMARLVAHRRPDLVRGVVTVSSPFAAHPHATNVWRAFEWLTGERVDDPRVSELRDEIIRPLPVPSLAIWSASDGLVNGRACRIDAEPSVEVTSQHIGCQLNPAVMLAVAEALATLSASPD
jgi:triacylglycerol lipase